MDKIVLTKWYGQSGKEQNVIRLKWYFTNWCGQNGTDIGLMV